MRIIIDLQALQTESRYRGIGRYSLGLAKAMITEGNKHDFMIVLNHALDDTLDAIENEFIDLLPRENIKVFSVPTPIYGLDPRNNWRRQSAELIREQFLYDLQPDWVHMSSIFEGLAVDMVGSVNRLYSIPTSLVLYDLIPYLYPRQYLVNPTVRSWYMQKLAYLSKSDLLLTISNYSKVEALENINITSDKIVNISADTDTRFRCLGIDPIITHQIRLRYNLKSDFIMYTGAMDPLKNLNNLIQSYSLLPQELRAVHQLIICGKNPNEERNKLLTLAHNYGLTKDEVLFTQYVSDEDLVFLYNMCKLFIFPSLHEGFGLPVLEAMRCGAPVIASCTTSVPEVVGLESALFNPSSVKSIRDKLLQALTDNDFMQQLRNHSKEQAKKFSWKSTAKLALESIESTYNRINSDNEKKYSNYTGTDRLISAIADIFHDSSIPDNELVQIAKAIAENDIPCVPKHLLFDVTGIPPKGLPMGIPRAVRAIFQQLLENGSGGCRLEAVYRSNGSYLYARRFTAELLDTGDDVLEDTPVEVSPGDIFLATNLDLGLGSDESAKTWLKYHRQRGLKVYYVLHDLLPIYRPDWFQPELCSQYGMWLPYITNNSDGIICGSQTVTAEFKSWLDSSRIERRWPLSIGCFYRGADVEGSFPSSGISPKEADFISHSSDFPTFLMVGVVWARKGHDQVLESMERLWAEGRNVRLVIVGSEGWGVDQLIEKLRKHPERGKRLFWFDHASDELLLKLYQSCSVLLVASEGEGFGLPIIEAARHRLPIIARDLPVFRELAGDHCFYFTGLDDFSLSNTIKKWLDLYKQEKYPRSDGIQWITWKESADQLKHIIFNNNWSTTWKYSKEYPMASSYDAVISVSGKDTSNKQSQLLLDVSELASQDAKSGIQRVVRSVLYQLISNPPTSQQVKPIYRSNGLYRYANNFIERITNSHNLCPSDGPVNVSLGDIYLGLDLDLGIDTLSKDLLRHYSTLGLKSYFIIYDMIPLLRPDWFIPELYPMFKERFEWVSSQADGLICISQAVASEVNDWLKRNHPIRSTPLPIGFFHLGADVENSLPSKGITSEETELLNRIHKGTSILMVGTLEPRKGYEQVWKALQELWQQKQDITLVVVGKQGWLQDKLVQQWRKHPEFGRKMIWFDHASDELLLQLYEKSSVLLMASEGEGFGLPLIEAAKHKLPIIARDLPVFREVAGDNAYYFNGKDVKSLSKAIIEWLNLYNKNRHPRSDSIPLLTWEQSVNQLKCVIYEDQWLNKWEPQ
jgi:glycosyltransferase involved in cell wall biosynthesis